MHDKAADGAGQLTRHNPRITTVIAAKLRAALLVLSLCPAAPRASSQATESGTNSPGAARQASERARASPAQHMSSVCMLTDKGHHDSPPQAG